MTFLLPLLLAAVLPTQPAGKCVLDEAKALTPVEFTALETTCEALDKSGDGQLEVVLTDDFRGDEKEEFANKLFHTWGIGHKDKNDGILIVLSPKMRKWRIEVGYGLEGRITDAQAAEIGRNLGVPAWKAARWGAGLVAVANAIVPLVHAEVKTRPTETHGGTSLWFIPLICILFAAGIGLVIILVARAERKRQDAERERAREHTTWLENMRQQRTSRAYRSSTQKRTPESKPKPKPKDDPVTSAVAAVAIVEATSPPTYESPSYDFSSSSSSDSGGGFSGGGGGDSGGGGAGGDF